MNLSTNETPCGLPRCLGMNAPVDLLPLIPDHWLAFPEPSKLIHVCLGCFFIIITPVSFIGNMAVIFLYCRSRRLQNSSNLLVMNLAIADLIMMSKAPIFIVNSFTQRPYTGRLGCEIYGFVSLVAGLSAIWFLTAISLERYRVVRLSITTRMSSKSQTRMVVWVVWVISGMLATIPLLGWNHYVPEGVLSGCTVDYLSERWVDRSFVFLLLLVAWTAPMAAVIFSYMYIVFRVRRSRMELRQLSDHHQTYSFPQRKTGTRVAMLVGLWAISWTPYALVVFVSLTFSNSVLTPLLSTMPSVFCKTSACLNPYVYGLSLPAFKKELKRFLPEMVRYCGATDTMKENEQSLPTCLTSHFDHMADHGPRCVPSSYILPSLAPASLQRFMLPNGDIVVGTSYKEAKQKMGRKQKTLLVNTRAAPSRHIHRTLPSVVSLTSQV